MELSGQSPAHRHYAPVYDPPVMLSARTSRFRWTSAPGVLGYLINRNYGVLLPAGRKAIRQYQIEHVHLLMGPPLHQALGSHRDNICQLSQVDEQTLVSASSDRTMQFFRHEADNDNDQTVWRLSQTLGDSDQDVMDGDRHQLTISDMACLSMERIVSCSHDHRVILWERQNGLWNDIETIFTGRACSDIAVLSSTLFIVSASSGDIGIFQYDHGHYHPRWFNSHSGFVLSLTVIDETEFVSFGFDGALRDWRLQQHGWSSIKYLCSESINRDEDNYPVTGVLLGKGIMAIGYSQGDILIRWQHRSPFQRRGGLWRKMQALRHGEEWESIKGIRPLMETRFVSYGEDAMIVLWQLKDWQWVAIQRLDKHDYPVSDCLSVGCGTYWTLDQSGVIECWQELGGGAVVSLSPNQGTAC